MEDELTRLIVLTWRVGKPLKMELMGDFDNWELKAALEEALALVDDTEAVTEEPEEPEEE